MLYIESKIRMYQIIKVFDGKRNFWKKLVEVLYFIRLK
jgi:hypothetical protein